VAFVFLPERTVEFYRFSITSETLENPVSSVYKRITLWNHAINDFKENPILGVGTGNSVGGTGFPHNIILEVSAELGLLGLLILIFMCYLTLKTAITFIKRKEMPDLNTLMKLSLLLFIFSLVEAMFSGFITNQTRFFMTMSLVISIKKMTVQKAKTYHKFCEAIQ
jgi:O-antigen ligase